MHLTFPNIDPIIFSFAIGEFTFALRWYSLAYIAGLLIAWRIMVVFANNNQLWKDSNSPIPTSCIEDLMTYMILGVILGGRIGYVLFYQPIYFLYNPSEILQVWKGGMSFHGGFLGVVLGTIIFAIKNKIPILSIGDLVAIASPPGLFLGRVANFINGELWGKPTTSDWGILFPAQAAQKCPDDWIGFCTRHPSQLYEAFLEGIILWFFMLALVFMYRFLERSGETIAIFLVGYGISRFVVENFRESDQQFVSLENPNGFVFQINDLVGLSMGQVLSIPMIIVGMIIILYSRTIRKT
jgi:phosphatidylglycerol:prolipoprotein diacylglycerol transferase